MKKKLSTFVICCTICTIIINMTTLLITCTQQEKNVIEESTEKKTITADEFQEKLYDGTRTFAQVAQLVEDKHYILPDVQSCFHKAIDAFLSEIDPHSGFMNPKTYKAMLESTAGEFFGTGIIIDNTRKTKDKFLIVIDTIPGGPADSAGLQPMDKIVEIDGKPIENMTTEEATSRLKGQRFTTVHVKVMRAHNQELLPFDITRDVVKEQTSLAFYLKDQNICYVSLSMFSENAAKQLKEILEKAKQKKYKAIILDLRNNSGGLLHSAVEICSFFIKKGSLVASTKNRKQNITEEYRTKNAPIASGNTPLFILINNYTASAAEILAGCLQIHAEKKDSEIPFVFLIGTKTFGKGSVQELIPLENNCAVKITTSLYFLPNNISIQATGIEPDFTIARTMPPNDQIVWFNKFYGHEAAYDNHIKTEASKKINAQTKENEQKKDVEKKSKEKTSIYKAEKLFESDNQLRETVRLINIFADAQKNNAPKVTTRQNAISYLKQHYITNEPFVLEEIALDKEKSHKS